MYRIALISPMLQPYRVSFYEKLANYDDDIELVVFHGVKKREDGRPAYEGDTKFRNVGLEEKKFYLGPFEIVLNVGLLKEIKKYNPHIIITQSIAGNLSNRLVVRWAKNNNKKIILWTCGWEPGRAKGILLNFKNMLVSRLFKKANLHLTYSTAANKYTQNMGVAPEKIFTCYNGIEIDDLLKDENRIIKESKEIEDKYSLKDYLTFLFVGGLIPDKKVDLLIDAFKNLKTKHANIKLMIIGDGPEKEKLLERIQNGGEDIYYLGRIINDVDKYFAASDCFVLPGVGGLALNQAMFWSKPCIVSEADGTEDDLVIDNETGFRFEKGNQKSLESAMEKMSLLNEEEKNIMSQKAREIIITKSNVNNMVDIFMNGIKMTIQELNKTT